MAQVNKTEKPMALDVLILAAGLGTRMKSRLAKVLHLLGGRPLIAHVCHSAGLLNPNGIYVVVGHQADDVKAAVETEAGKGAAGFVRQTEQLGTGDAVMAARNALADAGSTLLVLSGDVPLVRAETLCALIEQHRADQAACTILTVRLENPMGYGRMVRDESGKFVKIVGWYDNEWGYSNRCVQMLELLGK